MKFITIKKKKLLFFGVLNLEKHLFYFLIKKNSLIQKKKHNVNYFKKTEIFFSPSECNISLPLNELEKKRNPSQMFNFPIT